MLIDDYESNSYKSKQDKESTDISRIEKKVDKVVSGKVKTRKKSELAKIIGMFMSDDVDNIGGYILMDVLIPTAKDTFFDVLHTILYGGSGRSSSRSNASRYDYSRQYNSNSSSSKNSSHARSQSRYNYDDIILESRREAEDVLSKLDELINHYGYASIADLYDLVGMTGEFTDNKYGWDNLASAKAIHTRDGWALKLPKALALD